MYQADKTEARRYFELSKYLGDKLKLFEGYLSDRSGLGIIKREEIEQDIANKDDKQATEKLNELVQLYQKLKSNKAEYKEGYKPGTGNYTKYNKIISVQDVYNQVKCSEQLAECYIQLFTLTSNATKRLEYLHEISKQFIGCDKLLGMLKQSQNVLSKEVASIYNSLGRILLKLYDQKIDYQKLNDAISKESQLTQGSWINRRR